MRAVPYMRARHDADGPSRGSHPMTRKISQSDPTRMYANDVLERLSRANWWEPFALFLPTTIGIFAWVAFNAPFSALTALGLAFAALLFWTFAEYTLHRWLFHFHAHTPEGEKFVRGIHGIHHEFPNDNDRLVIPTIYGAALYIGFWALYVVIASFIVDGAAFTSLGFFYGSAFHVGFALGYLSYDFSHYAVHNFQLEAEWFKAAKRRHMMHHYRYPDACFGVSNGFWDRVFGTTVEASQAGIHKVRGEPWGQWRVRDNEVGKRRPRSAQRPSVSADVEDATDEPATVS